MYLHLFTQANLLCSFQKRASGILLLLFWSSIVLGQHFSFKNYTVRDGLPSANIYDLEQDEDGFIWISTEAGLCKFDGHSFQKNPISSLKSKEIVNIYKDSKHDLWFNDLANDVYCYKNDSIQEFDLSSFHGFRYLVDIQEDHNGDFWLLSTGDSGAARVVLEKNKDNASLEDFGKKSFWGKNTFLKNQNQSLILSRFGLNIINTDSIQYVPFEKKWKAPIGTTNILMPNKEDILVYFHNQLYFFSLKDYTFRPAFKEWEHLYQKGINYLSTDRSNNIWVTTVDGVVLLQQKDQSYTVKKLLEGKFIGLVFQDRDDNYWITSQKDGLFFLPSLEISSYKNPNFSIASAITTDNKNNIIIGAANSWLTILNPDLQAIVDQKIQSSDKYIYDLLYTEENYLTILCSDKIINWNPEKGETVFTDGSYKTGSYDTNSRLWYGGSSHLGYFEQKNRKHIGKKRTYAVLAQNEQSIFFGTVEGLYHYDGATLKAYLPNLIKADIRDIAITADSTFFLATHDKGVYILKEDKIIHHFTNQKVLNAELCKKVIVQDTIAWIATNNGLHKFNLNTQTFQIITADNGLADNEINDITRKEDDIIVATNKGISIFNQALDVGSTSPKMYLKSVKVQERDTTLQSYYELPFSQNNIKIEYSGLTFQNAGEIQYEHQLKGLQQDWIFSNINIAQYPALPAGNYTFLVRAKTHNSDWSKPLEVDFRIKPPFYQTYWFYGLMALLSLFIFYFINAELQRRNNVRQQMENYQLVALRAQMNPHFLFNALNSIQEFIVQQDKRTANRYLTQFSSLMRNILTMSDQDHISLAQEIDTLNLYLSLESMRFDDSFNYSITIDPSFDPSLVDIPPMLVQPYVENAIKHGLHHKKGQKQLAISFNKRENYLICIIEDNGIGRKRSKEINQINKQLYTSKAMQLTEKRLNLLNIAHKKSLNVQIEDLYNLQSQPQGTKIVLNILTKTI